MNQHATTTWDHKTLPTGTPFFILLITPSYTQLLVLYNGSTLTLLL